MATKTAPSVDMFEYELPSGKTIQILKFGRIPTGVIRRNRKKALTDQILSVLEEVADETALETIDATSQEELNEFVVAWQADAGVTVGKS